MSNSTGVLVLGGALLVVTGVNLYISYRIATGLEAAQASVNNTIGGVTGAVGWLGQIFSGGRQ